MYSTFEIEEQHLNNFIRNVNSVFKNSERKNSSWQAYFNYLESLKDKQCTAFEKFVGALETLQFCCKKLIASPRVVSFFKGNHQEVEKAHRLQKLISHELDLIDEVMTLKSNHVGSGMEWIDAALQLLKQHTKHDDAYDSLEHQLFCRRWKVSGHLQDYACFQNLAHMMNTYLDEHRYRTIWTMPLSKFGFDILSSLINTDDYKYDRFGSSTIHENHTAATRNLKALKLEIDIWTLENLTKLLINYLEKYALTVKNDSDLTQFRADNIKTNVFIPLVNHFVNPARKQCGKSQYAKTEIDFMLKQYDDIVETMFLKTLTNYELSQKNAPLIAALSFNELHVLFNPLQQLNANIEVATQYQKNN